MENINKWEYDRVFKEFDFRGQYGGLVASFKPKKYKWVCDSTGWYLEKHNRLIACMIPKKNYL